MRLVDVLARLKRVRKSGRGFMARCPAHDDRNPSLSIGWKDGRILVKCMAGCPTEDVLQAMGLTMSDLFDDEASSFERARARFPASSGSATRGTGWPTEWGVVVATYVYEDADGKPLHYVDRTSTKQFPQGRYVNGRKVKGLNGVKTVLFRLPELLAAPLEHVVYVAEGEKDVLALADRGLLATCNPGGALKFCADHVEPLRGRPVVIVMDRDEAGRNHARLVAGLLDGVAASVRIVQAKSGKDAYDHFAAGHSVEDFQEIDMSELNRELGADDTRKEATAPEVRSFADIQAVEVDWLWYPYLPRGEVTVLAGDGGVGKSLMALALAAALSLGKVPLSDQECEPINTLYVTAEDDPARALKPRLMKLLHNEVRIHVLDCGLGVSVDDWFETVRAACVKHEISLVIIDPLQSFSGERDLSKTHEARSAMQRFHALARELDCAVIIIAHFNKGTGGKAQYRVSGSTDIVNASRSAMIVGAVDRDGQEVKVMAHVKSNYSQRGPSTSFTTEGGAFKWGEPVAVTAEDISAGSVSSNKRDEAAEFLKTALCNGPMKQAEIEAKASEASISMATLRRAKSLLGVRSNKEYGVWWWSLAGVQDGQGAQDALGGNIEHVDHVGPTLNLGGAREDAQPVKAVVRDQGKLFGSQGETEEVA